MRSGWWIAIFLAVLAALLLPSILTAKDAGAQVPLWQQLVALTAASIICQALRRHPLSSLFGRADASALRGLWLGAISGSALMAAPALIFALTGLVSWQTNMGAASAIGPVLGVLCLAAAIEELTFRGFLFQRLLEGIGEWPAQIVVAAMFVLTHSDALASQGVLSWLAGANIFLASILFGLAYIRTRGLAMPFGLHFAANVTQGPVLGFGVSGDTQESLFNPTAAGAPDWLTGGTFGLEASLPGLMCLVALAIMLWRWRGA